MSYTANPVMTCPCCQQTLIFHDLNTEDNKRIMKRIDGCEGLNPSAYRQCVEALDAVRHWLIGKGDILQQVDEALTAAQESKT